MSNENIETDNDRRKVLVVPELPDNLLAETQASFELFAVDGRMNLRYMYSALRSMGVDATDDDVIVVVEEHDPDGHGYITMDQWTAAMARRWTEDRARRKKFRSMLAAGDDAAVTGQVSVAHLRAVLNSFDPTATMPVDVDEMVATSNSADTGYIDYDNFMATMVRPSRLDQH